MLSSRSLIVLVPGLLLAAAVVPAAAQAADAAASPNGGGARPLPATREELCATAPPPASPANGFSMESLGDMKRVQTETADWGYYRWDFGWAVQLPWGVTSHPCPAAFLRSAQLRPVPCGRPNPYQPTRRQCNRVPLCLLATAASATPPAPVRRSCSSPALAAPCLPGRSTFCPAWLLGRR